ncbi:MAG: ABC transporter substrate-binding protein, partial [Candidatus Woesearchaeota archaeon]|nr:ABC transporter substrate-binding protein [Candidatus Woesearchaeota archaeon]
NILVQASSLGLSAQSYMAYYGGSKSIKDIAGLERIEGLIWIDVAYDETAEATQKLFKRYASKQGTAPSLPVAIVKSYDRTMIIANALRACGEDTLCMKKWLYAMPAYQGVGGLVQFDAEGELLNPKAAVFQIKSGTGVRID